MAPDERRFRVGRGGRPQALRTGITLESMEKRVWLSSSGSDLAVTKTEPVSIGLNVSVSVRPGDEAIASDGVWLNGERSYDTTILIDGDVRYHSPLESAQDRTFELHEAAGGGRIL